MRQSISSTFVLLVALSSSLGSFNALAANDKHASCPFLIREELSGIGVTKDTDLTDSDWVWDETPKETPTAKVITNLCTITLKSKGENTSVVLAVDRFDGKVTEAQVGNWIKAVASTSADDEDIKTVTLGDTVCETGNYELPTTQEDGSSANINEHYVACDTQVGTRHVSLNVHVPETKKALLPSAEQTKAILEKSVKRLKEASLGQKT